MVKSRTALHSTSVTVVLMKLYLLRHGKAEDVSSTGLDKDRELTAEGIAEMRVEAATLASIKLKVDMILTSPYPRARTTAEIVAKSLGLEAHLRSDDRLACGFSLAELEELVEENGSIERLMLVGHNPDFADIAGELAGGAIIDLKKGGLVRLDVQRIEPGGGILEWVLTPTVLTR